MPGALQSGRVILQGQHEIPLCWVSLTIEHFLAWFPLANDFLKNQPIKGADIYYMRMILHNWADSYCLQILKLLREAAAPNSRLLIVESIMWGYYHCKRDSWRDWACPTGTVTPKLGTCECIHLFGQYSGTGILFHWSRPELNFCRLHT